MTRQEEIKERLRIAHKRRWANPEYRKKITEYNKEWAKKHPELVRARALKWRNRNLELARSKERAWRKKNRVYTQIRDHNRRAAKLAVTINPKSIALFIENTRLKQLVKCYYCSKRFSGKLAHFDHIIPLAKGGPHSVENLCVSCPNCNQTKHSKMVKDWMRLGQQLLEL